MLCRSKCFVPILIAVVVILGYAALAATQNWWPFEAVGEKNGKHIVTFEQCVKAGNVVMESFPEQCRTEDGLLFVNWQGAGQFCIQVITPAINPETGEVREFPTPCDVPIGWEATEPELTF